MKIVEPKAGIIEDELSQLSIYQRIAYCAGVCYQREPRKTEEEAQAFCRRMVETVHLSTLEMAVVHLVFDWENFSSTAIRNNHYIKVTTGENPYEYVLSGSVRALLETTGYVADDIRRWLGSNGLSLFFECDPRKYTTFDIRFALPHEIPWQHQHVAVRFIVNRAVSHELVRHRPMSFLQESQRYCRYEDEVVFIRPEWATPDDTAMSMQEAIWIDSVKRSENAYRNLLKNGLKPQQARAVLPNSTKTELIAYASLPQWKHMFKLRCSPAADPEMRRVMIPLEQEFKEKYPEAFNEQDH